MPISPRTSSTQGQVPNLNGCGWRRVEVETRDHQEQRQADPADVDRAARADLRADRDQAQRDQQQHDVPEVAGLDRRCASAERIQVADRRDPEGAADHRRDAGAGDELGRLPEAEIPGGGRRAGAHVVAAGVVAPHVQRSREQPDREDAEQSAVDAPVGADPAGEDLVPERGPGDDHRDRPEQELNAHPRPGARVEGESPRSPRRSRRRSGARSGCRRSGRRTGPARRGRRSARRRCGPPARGAARPSGAGSRCPRTDRPPGSRPPGTSGTWPTGPG